MSDFSPSPQPKPASLTVLGIETSCDETAVAVVNSQREILGHLIHSQVVIHQPYGGVVPEVAARDHMAKIPQLLEQVLATSGLGAWDKLDAIAVTAGPGLIGGLMVGVMVAKGMAAALEIPCIPVNHLVGHALTPRLVADVDFPYLLLLTSGGHCQLALVFGPERYEVLGQTVDDAAGEAFDKLAKMLGLSYPGGPIVESLAATGNPQAFELPVPFQGTSHCNFSFSGLKTAASRIIAKSDRDDPRFVADICASFQAAVATSMADRLTTALATILPHSSVDSLVLSGGVAANRHIRTRLEGVAAAHGLSFYAPPLHLCTDNGAMIAWAGIEMMRHDSTQGARYRDLSFPPRSRWPLGS